MTPVNSVHTPSLLDAIEATPAEWPQTRRAVAALETLAETYRSDAEKLRDDPDLTTGRCRRG